MAHLWTVLQLTACFLIPAVILVLQPRLKLFKVLPAVIVCYLAGMLLGNLPGLRFDTNLSLQLCAAMVALAIPLLLFSMDVLHWLRLARSTVISFCSVTVTVMLASVVGHLVFGGQVVDSPRIAGMLTGVYIGTTANIAAIATATGVPSETFILLNAADMAVSFAYLMFITTLAPRILKGRLPDFVFSTTTQEWTDDNDQRSDVDEEARDILAGAFKPRHVAAGLALAGLLMAVSLGLRLLVPDTHKDLATMMSITTLAVAASFSPRIRRIPGTGQTGQFLFLVFCVSMGFTTDFAKLFSANLVIIFYCALVVGLATFLHLVIAWLLRIDRDTAIVTSVAGIFGPHMIAPAAMALRNREVLFSGIVTALVGIAIGNYCGLMIIWMLNG